jgi:hypothetical protein
LHGRFEILTASTIFYAYNLVASQKIFAPKCAMARMLRLSYRIFSRNNLRFYFLALCLQAGLEIGD